MDSSNYIQNYLSESCKRTLEDAAKEFKATGNKALEGNAYGILAEFYCRLKDPNSARYNLEKIKMILPEIKNHQETMFYLVVLVSIHRCLGEYSNAINYNKEGLRLEVMSIGV